MQMKAKATGTHRSIHPSVHTTPRAPVLGTAGTSGNNSGKKPARDLPVRGARRQTEPPAEDHQESFETLLCLCIYTDGKFPTSWPQSSVCKHERTEKAIGEGARHPGYRPPRGGDPSLPPLSNVVSSTHFRRALGDGTVLPGTNSHRNPRCDPHPAMCQPRGKE